MSKSLTATLKYALSSAKKMDIVAKMIRGKNVDEAQLLLRFLPKKSAKILLKVVKSAVANATNNEMADSDKLYVSKIDIGKGPRIKRMKFVGRGRMHPFEKHRCFVRVVLDNK